MYVVARKIPTSEMAEVIAFNTKEEVVDFVSNYSRRMSQTKGMKVYKLEGITSVQNLIHSMQTPPTARQIKCIGLIQYYLGVLFAGKTTADASEFITTYLDDSYTAARREQSRNSTTPIKGHEFIQEFIDEMSELGYKW